MSRVARPERHALNRAYILGQALEAMLGIVEGVGIPSSKALDAALDAGKEGS